MTHEETIKDNEYKCSMCQNVYEKGWSDEESEKEAKKIWGNIPTESRCVICDDCFHRRSPQDIQEMGEDYKNLNN